MKINYILPQWQFKLWQKMVQTSHDEVEGGGTSEQVLSGLSCHLTTLFFVVPSHWYTSATR